MLVLSETVLVLSETVLVLSETVLVLVIETSLSWCYFRSTHDLPPNATKLVQLSEHGHEREREHEHEHGHGREHEHEHEHGNGPESQSHWPLFCVNSQVFRPRIGRFSG